MITARCGWFRPSSLPDENRTRGYGTQVAGRFRLSRQYREFLEGFPGTAYIAAGVQPAHPRARGLARRRVDRPLFLSGLAHPVWPAIPAVRAGHTEDLQGHTRGIP